MLTSNNNPFSVQLISQHPRSHERILQMQFIQSAHERQIRGMMCFGLIIDSAAAYPDQLRLSCNGERMGSVYYRLALSNPILVSAPSKKSFSRVNCPIFACRAFKST